MVISPLPVRMTWNNLGTTDEVWAFAYLPPGASAITNPPFLPSRNDPVFSDNKLASGCVPRKSAVDKSAPDVRRYDQDWALAESRVFGVNNVASYDELANPSLRAL